MEYLPGAGAEAAEVTYIVVELLTSVEVAPEVVGASPTATKQMSLNVFAALLTSAADLHVCLAHEVMFVTPAINSGP
jgi:hypothetical protein